MLKALAASSSKKEENIYHGIKIYSWNFAKCQESFLPLSYTFPQTALTCLTGPQCNQHPLPQDKKSDYIPNHFSVSRQPHATQSRPTQFFHPPEQTRTAICTQYFHYVHQIYQARLQISDEISSSPYINLLVPEFYI